LEPLDLIAAAIKASPRTPYLDALCSERAGIALAPLPTAEQITIATTAADAIRQRDYNQAYAILEQRDADLDQFAERAESAERIKCAWCGLPSSVLYTHCYHCSRDLRTGELTPIRQLSESPGEAKERKERKRRKQGEPPPPEPTRCGDGCPERTPRAVGGSVCNRCGFYYFS
jgi:hypothetical protein